MTTVQKLLKEMEQEAQTTRKILERVPNDKYDWDKCDWKLYEKSTPVRQLAIHIVELPTWVSMALTTEELDFATSPYEPKNISNTAELMDLFEQTLEDGKIHLAKATDEDLLPEWTLRNGEQIYNVYTKEEVIRHAFSEIIHHRAQLDVYLGLLNKPIQSSYGPGAEN